MPYFRVAYIASTSLPCFSVRCSHVIFLVSFLLSCYLRLDIYNNNNFRTVTYLNRTFAYMAFGLWSAPIRYVFLPCKAEHFFPQATKDDGSNRWSKCFAHLAIICEPTAPAIAYGLGINVLIFDLPLQARLLMSLISEKKIRLGWSPSSNIGHPE